jgi:superfamily II DNA or RNA helicase
MEEHVPPRPETPTLNRYAELPKPKVVTPIKQMTFQPKVVLDLPVELRDYQKRAVSYALSHPHCIIELPTGRGKTITGLAIVNELIGDVHRPTLVIVPTTVLLTQWIEDGFKSAGVEATGVSGEEKKWSDFTVVTYQSAIKHLDKVAGYDIVIFDEVHHLFAPEYSRILTVLLEQPQQKYLIGLTATVKTIGEGYTLQQRYFPDIFRMTISQFQNRTETHIPVAIFAVPVQLSQTERELYDRFQATISRANKLIGPMPEWPKRIGSNSSESVLARQALVAYANQNTLLATMETKIEEVVKIITQNPGQFIIFSDSIDQMKNYINAISEHGITVGGIYSGVRAAERKKILNGLKDGSIRVLVGGNAISEGLDLPDISNGVITSFLVKEQRTLIQRIGRLMRPKPNKSVRIWLVYAKYTKEEQNALHIEKILGQSIQHPGGL